jgi:hypothetical protein
MPSMKLRLTITAVLALAIIAVPATAAGGGNGPKVLRVLLEKGDRGGSDGFSLSANIRNADSVTFKTRYNGDRAAGDARYNDHVTTTGAGFHGTAKHPWQLRRNADGKADIKLIRASLKATGQTTIKVKAVGEGGQRSKTKVTFVASECHMDPPIYPLTCTWNR